MNMYNSPTTSTYNGHIPENTVVSLPNPISKFC